MVNTLCNTAAQENQRRGGKECSENLGHTYGKYIERVRLFFYKSYLHERFLPFKELWHTVLSTLELQLPHNLPPSTLHSQRLLIIYVLCKILVTQ